MDRTGNHKKRPPLCPVTRAMADAGKAKLDTMTGMDTEEEAPISDDMLVAGISTVSNFLASLTHISTISLKSGEFGGDFGQHSTSSSPIRRKMAC